MKFDWKRRNALTNSISQIWATTIDRDSNPGTLASQSVDYSTAPLTCAMKLSSNLKAFLPISFPQQQANEFSCFGITPSSEQSLLY